MQLLDGFSVDNHQFIGRTGDIQRVRGAGSSFPDEVCRNLNPLVATGTVTQGAGRAEGKH